MFKNLKISQNLTNLFRKEIFYQKYIVSFKIILKYNFII